ncbi:S41 family peptidase [Streptomyces sp. NPDC001404]|uniref:S41 family peptidase n=1 Tax=Streptomyces sp. NPDC001404 TaxID=3364571 RepID=UPI0036D1D176
MPGPTMFVPQRRTGRAAALTLVFVGVLATGAAAGSWATGPHDARTPARHREASSDSDADHPPPRTAAERAAADRAVDDRAVEDAARQAVEDGKSGSAAASEVVSRSGDRWSSVYTAAEYEGLERALDGAYVGVGLSARRGSGGRMEIEEVRPGSPAARAGIAPGDRLRTVDGDDVTGRPVTDVVAGLRGDKAWGAGRPGTPVRLGLQRGRRAWERTLLRERLVTESVTVDRPDGPGGPLTRIRVGPLVKGAGARIRDAVQEAGPGEGVLLDLRGSPGGLVSEAVSAASAFLDGGVIATYDLRGRHCVLRAEHGGDTRRPLVVLVDGGTMSAAELLAGALQDRGRAVLVGSRTFGKGSVQMPSRLADGSVAELTVGHYRTPDGHAVDGVGIAPDVIAEGDAEERARTVFAGLGGGA